MNIRIAPNAFKGTLSARQVAGLLAEEARRAWPEGRLTRWPLADGGDGTLECLSAAAGALRRRAVVRGPRGEKIRAPWLRSADGRWAAVEMARASGVALLPPRRRDPEKTTSFGTGQLIDAARRAGARDIWVGLGGTATVDGGAGLLQAMGADLRHGEDRLASPATGRDLARITRIDAAAFRRRWAGVRFTLLTDVRNPLTGPRGAARAFGPQKGATKTQVARLARGLARWADALVRAGGRDPRALPGGGAAGGAAAGLWSLAGARVVPGARWAVRRTGLEKSLARGDLVITGEGRIDRTTFEGKAVGELLSLARRRGTDIVLVTGAIAPAVKARVARAGARTVVLGAPPRDRRSAARVLRRKVRAAFKKWGKAFL